MDEKREQGQQTDFKVSKKVMFDTFLKRLVQLRFNHRLSGAYYEKKNMQITAPSIIITSFSGMASFLSTSTMVAESRQSSFGLTVGIMASIASLLQSFSVSFKFGTKAEMHRTAAEEYNKLIVKTKFEMLNPNEEDFFDTLEEKILEVQGNCKYFPPQFICDKWFESSEKKSSDAELKEIIIAE